MGRTTAIRPEIRGKIIAYHEAGRTNQWIVRQTGASLSSVQRFIRCFRNDQGRGLLPQGVPVAKKPVDACLLKIFLECFYNIRKRILLVVQFLL